MTECPLCNNNDTDIVLKDNIYTYFKCSVCALYFVDPDQRLKPGEEKLRYDQHENDPLDQNYRTFLSQLFEPVVARVSPGASGLDYGSGPGPTLHMMFDEAGFKMSHYDPIYYKKNQLLNQKYDFITVSETAEHFYHPGKEFRKLWQMLNPGGILGVMTLLLNKPENFKNWFYRREDTHVSFYQPDTFRWLSRQLNATIEFHGNRVILLRKPDTA